MLSEQEVDDIWQSRLSAETYALYFGDFANRYTRQKQWITFISFFFSSSAAGAVLVKLPPAAPVLLSAVVAVATAYSVAMGLDSRIRTMAKLHYSWNQISEEYSRLWSDPFSEGSAEAYRDILRRERELSELATTDAPNDQKRLGRWQEQVWKLHRLTSA